MQLQSPDRSDAPPRRTSTAVGKTVDRWFDDHGPAVLGLLRQTVSPERAGELLAEAFRRVAQHLNGRERAGKPPLDRQQIRARLLLTARELASAGENGGAANRRESTQDSATFPLLNGPLAGNGHGVGATTSSATFQGSVANGLPRSEGEPDRRQQVRTALTRLSSVERCLLQDVVLGSESLEKVAERCGLQAGEARAKLLAALRNFRFALNGAAPD